MNKPLISIITSVFNGEKYFEQAIQSILNQTYQNIEYIIIDGNSTDQTISIIKKYQDQITYWVSEPDQGIYDAWNKGVKAAKGEWISFVGADDILYPNAMENYVNYILMSESKDKGLDYLSAKVELVKEDLEVVRTFGEVWKWGVFKKYMNVAHVGSLHHKNLFKKYGFYNTDYKIVGDYELLLRANKHLEAGFINDVTAKMRFGGVSIKDFTVFKETFKAKVKTANCNPLICYCEMLIAICKRRVRNLIKLP